MAAISQTIFSDAFSWMKSFVFSLKFYWSLFLRLQLTRTNQILRHPLWPCSPAVDHLWICEVTYVWQNGDKSADKCRIAVMLGLLMLENLPLCLGGPVSRCNLSFGERWDIYTRRNSLDSLSHTMSRDHSVYTPSQWEMKLQCNIISYRLGAYPKRSQHVMQYGTWNILIVLLCCVFFVLMFSFIFVLLDLFMNIFHVQQSTLV